MLCLLTCCLYKCDMLTIFMALPLVALGLYVYIRSVIFGVPHHNHRVHIPEKLQAKESFCYLVTYTRANVYEKYCTYLFSRHMFSRYFSVHL